MHFKILSLSLATCFLCSFCARKQSSEGLKKLSYDELYERALSLNLDPEKIEYRNEKNIPISPAELERYSRDSFAIDKYVDKTDSVRLWVVRPIRTEDIELRKKMQDLYDNDIEYSIKYINLTVKDSLLRENILSTIHLNRPITPVKINCDSAEIILKAVSLADQNNRTANQINGQVDRDNQIQVVSILEQCGFPENFVQNTEAVFTVFMVIQHASVKLRHKYFPLLQKAAAMGALERRDLALMEDRILMDQGKKQKFGSQVRMIGDSGQYEVYPIDNPTQVDARRAEIGLYPMQDYLSRFNINWAEYLEKQSKD